MGNMLISVKLKKNKSSFLSDLKKRSVESRLTALRNVLRKVNATEGRFVIKNFNTEVNCLFKTKGNIQKSLALYKKIKTATKKSK